MEGVLRHGSAERMEYIRRFVAVLLALVLCMGLLRPPRVGAMGGEVGMLLAGGSSVLPVVAVAGGVLLTLAGVDFLNGMCQTGQKTFYGSVVYDAGYAFSQTIGNASAAVQSWWADFVARIEANPTGIESSLVGVQVPAEVLEYARTWVIDTYDFSSGSVNYENSFLVFPDGSSLKISGISTLHPANSWTGPWDGVGYLFPSKAGATNSIELVDSAGVVWSYQATSNWRLDYYFQVERNVLVYSLYRNPSEYRGEFVFILIDYNGNYILAPAIISMSGNIVYDYGKYIYDESSFLTISHDSLHGLNSSMTKTPVLDEPITESLTIESVPDVVGHERVGVYDVPIWDELTREGILVGSGEIVDPVDPPIESDPPIVGDQTMVGDIALEDVAKEQESLGAVFISKFPFCIPWDMYHAVKLLSAPTKTPYWEIDFLAPISGRVGGWRGSTKVVIDMGEYEIIGQVSRWVSTILFCATLISGTKKLVWTG